MTEPIQATAGDVVAAKHPEGTLVTVTGVCGLSDFHTTKQGNPWVSGWLYGDDTAVQVRIPPKPYSEFQAILGPTADEYRPPTATIAGFVVGGEHGQPAIQATEVVRLSGPAAHGLDHFRVTQAQWRLVALEYAAQNTATAIADDPNVSVESVLKGLIKVGQALLPIVASDGPLRQRINALKATDQYRAACLDDDTLMVLFDLESLASRTSCAGGRS